MTNSGMRWWDVAVAAGYGWREIEACLVVEDSPRLVGS
jgi:hypothetical protein